MSNYENDIGMHPRNLTDKELINAGLQYPDGMIARELAERFDRFKQLRGRELRATKNGAR